MADEAKVGQDPEVQTPATPEPVSEPSPAPESGNEGANNLKESQERADSKLSYEELDEKYRNSSKESRKWKEEAEKKEALIEQAQKTLYSQVTKTRESWEDYLNDQNLSPEQKLYYMNIYDTEISPQKSQAQVTEGVANQNLPSGSVQPMNPVRESWMAQKDQEVMDKMKAQKEASDEFFARPENESLSATAKQAIIANAEMLDLDYGFTPSEALVAARRRVLSPEEIANEGYVSGVRDAMSGGVSRGVSGGSSGTDRGVKLPPVHEQFINAEISRKGLSGKAADDYRAAYTQKVTQKSNN